MKFGIFVGSCSYEESSLPYGESLLRSLSKSSAGPFA